jgi:uncharacterized protein involved in response to NO
VGNGISVENGLAHREMRAGPWLASEAAVAGLHRDPWRLFFPVAVLLGWAGVLHWLFHGLGVTERYDAVFHATAQIQGFMTCMALGFLFTFIPRRTATAPPSSVVLAAGLTGPIAAALAAWWGHWALAQASWASAIAVVTVFVGRRVLNPDAARRVPGVFLWVPVALLAGVAGAALVAIAAALGPQEEPELWLLGRGLLLQGFVTALVVGVGGTMLPTLTRGEPGPNVTSRAWTGLLGQATAAIVFLASFPLEIYVDPRLGFAIRALVAGGVLASAARLWRPPSAPGLHRRLIWIAAWLLPLGYLAAAIDPAQRSAALHLVFIGSFALMALSVSLHVALSHGGHPERLTGRPWQAWVLGLSLLAAVVFRCLVGADPARLKVWLVLAAGSFLLATIAWASLVAPAVHAAGKDAGR